MRTAVSGVISSLMVAQTVALALGALPIYALAKHVLKSRWVACALAVAYLLYTPMQMVNIEGGQAYNPFRPISFSIPLFLAALYYLVLGRMRPFAVFAVLVLLCKQEFALTFFMLGLYLAVVERRRKLGLGMAVFSLVYLAGQCPDLDWRRGVQAPGEQCSDKRRRPGARPTMRAGWKPTSCSRSTACERPAWIC